jgi:hypothetical protein
MPGVGLGPFAWRGRYAEVERSSEQVDRSGRLHGMLLALTRHAALPISTLRQALRVQLS